MVWCCWRCANPVPPSGGPRDEQPPRLDLLRSTPNYQTRFRKQPIELTFDEWIRLEDPLNQIVVSPPLQYPPEVKLRKKTLVFRFDEREQLKENATYTIHFGEAIQDLTEGNVASVRFLFSTGPYIDSLVVEGLVVDAFSGEPVEGVRVMLYDDLADSAAYVERPFYFGTTDARGRVRIENVRADTFRVLALADANRNYRFDAGERIAFADSLLLVRDTLTHVPPLRLFAEEPPLHILGQAEPHYGLLRLWCSRPPREARLVWDTTLVRGFVETVRDSLLFWYVGAETPFQVWLFLPEGVDTLQVAARGRDELARKAPLQAHDRRSAVFAQRPDQPFSLDFSHPLARLDTSRILLLDTAGRRLPLRVQLDGPARRTLSIAPQAGWPEGQTCPLTLLPDALTDIFGLTLADTLRLSLRVGLRDEFGALALTLEPLDTAMQYVLQLWRGEDQQLDVQVWRGLERWSYRWPLLEPGTYRLVLIEDRDASAHWTPGHFATRRQPERVFVRTLEEIRPNWEVEASVAVEW